MLAADTGRFDGGAMLPFTFTALVPAARPGCEAVASRVVSIPWSVQIVKEVEVLQDVGTARSLVRLFG
jgi:hypothetical protein